MLFGIVDYESFIPLDIFNMVVHKLVFMSLRSGRLHILNWFSLIQYGRSNMAEYNGVDLLKSLFGNIQN